MLLQEMFQEQYAMNVVNTEEVCMLFGLVNVTKDDKGPVGLVIEELFTKNLDGFPVELDKILTAMSEKVGRQVKKVVATVKLKNKHLSLNTQALLAAGFRIEKSDDKNLLFVKDF